MIRRIFTGRKNVIAKALVVALFCSILPISINAQAATSEGVLPAIGLNAKGLLFTFNGLSFLGTGVFNGGIGGKYYLQESIALRTGLQFLMVSKSIPANPPVGVSGTDGSQSVFQIGVSPAIEYHLSKARLSPFVGGGLLFSTTSTVNKTAVTGGAASVETDNATGGETIDGIN